MHDAITFELRGVPSVVICSEPFTNTAKAMARSSGLPDYRFAVIPHPVGSNGREELTAKAELVFDQAIDILLEGNGKSGAWRRAKTPDGDEAREQGAGLPAAKL